MRCGHSHFRDVFLGKFGRCVSLRRHWHSQELPQWCQLRPRRPHHFFAVHEVHLALVTHRVGAGAGQRHREGRVRGVMLAMVPAPVIAVAVIVVGVGEVGAAGVGRP